MFLHLYVMYVSHMCHVCVMYVHFCVYGVCVCVMHVLYLYSTYERWGAGVETQKYVRRDIGGWGRVPFNETYAPSLSTIYDGA